MAKKENQSVSSNPGMVLVATYIVLFAVSALVIYLANMFFPQQVVLGTASMSSAWAILHSMGTLALINAFAIPFNREFEKLKGRMLTPKEWMIKYFVLNFVGIWVITRFSDQFGLGVSAWYVIVALAVVLDMIQGVVMMQIEKFRVER